MWEFETASVAGWYPTLTSFREQIMLVLAQDKAREADGGRIHQRQARGKLHLQPLLTRGVSLVLKSAMLSFRFTLCEARCSSWLTAQRGGKGHSSLEHMRNPKNTEFRGLNGKAECLKQKSGAERQPSAQLEC